MSAKKKELIILGHVVSEQAGMKHCADWLKGFVTEVLVEFSKAGLRPISANLSIDKS